MKQNSNPFQSSPTLLNLGQVAVILGQPLSSVRRWIHHPPAGFPPRIRIGRKILVRSNQLEAWARGEAVVDAFPVVQSSAPGVVKTRGRGRPRKVEKS